MADSMRLALPGLVVVAMTLLPVFRASEAAGPVPPPSPTLTAAPASSFILHRQLDAAVSQVDRDAGVLLLKTDAGRLTLDGAAGAASALRQGESVVLDVAVLRHPDPDRIPRDKVSERPLLVRRLSAEVTGVERSVGLVALKTPAGRLNLDLPKATIANLRTGDRLSLELTLLHESDVSAMPRMEGRERRAGLAALLMRLFGQQGARSRR